MQEAALDQATMARADLGGAVLLGARLWQADLRSASLREADLSHASLNEARLEGATFHGAKFDSTDLTAAYWDPIIGGGGPRGSYQKETPLDQLESSPSVLSRLGAKGIRTAEDLVKADLKSLLAANAAPAESIDLVNQGSVLATITSLLAADDAPASAERLIDLLNQALLVTCLGQLNNPSIRQTLRDYGIRTLSDFVEVFGPDAALDPKRSALAEDSPLAPFLERFREIAAYLTRRRDSGDGDS
jgi:hypothetical protein